MVACCVGCTTRNDIWTCAFPNLRDDIPEYRNTNVKLFADDTKLFNNNTNRTECQDLQYDLNALSAWSKTWQISMQANAQC